MVFWIDDNVCGLEHSFVTKVAVGDHEEGWSKKSDDRVSQREMATTANGALAVCHDRRLAALQCFRDRAGQCFHTKTRGAPE
jgi:hypothetical protein